MGWLLRGTLILVLGLLFIKITLGLLGALLPLALMILVALALWAVLKRLLCGCDAGAGAGGPNDVWAKTGPASRLDRIQERIERLEAVLSDRK
ncbi:MAG: hypothetical protein N3D11_00615 [Candidatus Sumerlaeia bacterium]|nr:hypothetical protein [Candidatus Sumerlaeia bacterium]